MTAGEEKWIFPFQEEADAMFNSALIYELAALRAQALPLLEMVPECAPEYSEAYRLRKFISYFAPMPLDAVPPTSLLREFMGHSVFRRFVPAARRTDRRSPVSSRPTERKNKSPNAAECIRGFV